MVPILGPALERVVGWAFPHLVSAVDPVLSVTLLIFAVLVLAVTAALAVVIVVVFEAIRTAVLIGCFQHARHLPGPSSSPPGRTIAIHVFQETGPHRAQAGKPEAAPEPRSTYL